MANDNHFIESDDFDVRLFDDIIVDPGGTAPVYHNDLKSRDAGNAHPISAITGLELRLTSMQNAIDILEEKVDGGGGGDDPEPVDPDDIATDQEVEDYLYGGGSDDDPDSQIDPDDIATDQEVEDFLYGNH